MELPPHTFNALTAIIHKETGIVLGLDKAYLVRHRLEPLIRAEGLASFDDLLMHLRSPRRAAFRDAVIDAITVKETRFFRDQPFFDVLQKHVLPACAASLAAPGKGRHRVRIWSAAASTGQEAYSVAMLAREFIASGGACGLDEGRVSILASDISPTAIESARAGKYGKSDIHRGVSEARLQRHFHHSGGVWRIDDSLQRMVQFRAFNLLNSISDLGAFDLILCRNVMIYFDEPTRRRIYRALYASLHEGGWLGLGSAESLYGMEEKFETHVLGKTIVYRKPCRAG